MSASASGTVSVGICAYNEGQNLGRLLERLLEEPVQEIIVATSGCIDETEEIARGVAARDPRVRLISEAVRKGKAHAFNQILRAYEGNYLISIPADVVPMPGLVTKLIDHMKPDVGVVGGLPISINPRGRVLDDVSRLIWTLHNLTLESLSASGVLDHVSGEVFALRRGIINSVPENTVNEDSFVALAAKLAGFRVIICRDARVTMMGARTTRDYLVQRRRILYGHLQSKKHFGRFPSVIEFELLARPKRAWSLVRSLIRRPGWTLFPLFVAILLEIVAFALAVGDFLTGRTHQVWKLATSTKRLDKPWY